VRDEAPHPARFHGTEGFQRNRGEPRSASPRSSAGKAWSRSWIFKLAPEEEALLRRLRAFVGITSPTPDTEAGPHPHQSMFLRS